MASEDIDAAVEAAVAHHRAGRLREAEAGYRAALAADPSQARAAHNLAGLLQQKGEVAEALGWFVRAYEADPAGPWWNAYARALIRAGRFADAEAVLDGRAEPAAAALEIELRRRWGFALIAEGDAEGAEAQFLLVQALAADDPNALADLGFAQLRAGRYEDARGAFEAALAQAPDDARTLVNLGTALRRLGQLDAAEARYREALAVDPDNEAAQLNLSTLRRDEAAADQAEQAAPDASVRRADALARAGRLDESLKTYLAAATAAQSPETLTKLGVNLAALGRHAEALTWLDQAVDLAPEDPEPRHERAFVRLAAGDYEGGWDDYEHRWRTEGFAGSSGGLSPQVRDAVELFAERRSLAGADVQLIAEQGIGDQIMFAGMIPDLAAEAASVRCMCDARLIRLFSHSIPGVEFAAEPGDLAGRRVIPFGSLGRLYRNTHEDIPRTPYLAPRAEVVAAWAERLGPRPEGLRIGLSWRGGVRRTRMEKRSLPLDALAPLLDLAGCEFVSLQYGDVAEEVAAVNAGRARPIRVFPAAETDDFEDLAGLVKALDVVVSVQTALIHVAGAIGQPALVMVPSQPEWRYGAKGPRMPWYGSVELFRQPQPGDWESVIAEVREALAGRITERG